MFNDPSSLKEAAQKLNAVSPTFCMAKWMHCSIHLHLGRTHSCHLPHHHEIPLKEIKKDPSALHNTSYKKDVRKLMLEGKRPEECQTCWDIEDLPEERFSERHFYGQYSWTRPFFQKVINNKWDKAIDPSYVEVSFSSVCNFKCSYCGPSYSSSWAQEIAEKGPYELTNKNNHHSLEKLKKDGLVPLLNENNPYREAFWKWWPTLRSNLMFFRITGGEPLLSEDTFKLLSMIEKEPMPNLELSINSNLGVSSKQFERLLTSAKHLVDSKKIKHFIIHASIDTYGIQAEYIRDGLDFNLFDKNITKYLEEMPCSSLSLTCTFNALSIAGFVPFLEWVISLRERFLVNKREIYLDLPHLQHPSFQSCAVLTDDFLAHFQNIIDFMEKRCGSGPHFRPGEILKMKRVRDWFLSKRPKNKQDEQELEKNQIDFYLYFNQYDQRRKKDFVETFPELRAFYNHCRDLWSKSEHI